jgi:hypothetical protein
MTPVELSERLERVRELLREIPHIALGTTNADSSPLISPVYAAFDGELRAFWSSHPESLHSRNIARDPRVFIAVFDSRAGHGGLFIKGKASPLSDQALRHGHSVLEERKRTQNRTMGDLERFDSTGPQRIYAATPERFWLNFSDRDGQGLVVRDRRHEITLQDLLASETR